MRAGAVVLHLHRPAGLTGDANKLRVDLFWPEDVMCAAFGQVANQQGLYLHVTVDAAQRNRRDNDLVLEQQWTILGERLRTLQNLTDLTITIDRDDHNTQYPHEPYGVSIAELRSEPFWDAFIDALRDHIPTSHSATSDDDHSDDASSAEHNDSGSDAEPPPPPIPPLRFLRLHRMTVAPRCIASILRRLPDLESLDVTETTEYPTFARTIARLEKLPKLRHLSYGIDLERTTVGDSLLESVLGVCGSLNQLCVVLRPAPSLPPGPVPRPVDAQALPPESVNALLRILHRFPDPMPLNVTLLLRGFAAPHVASWRQVDRFYQVNVDLRFGEFTGAGWPRVFGSSGDWSSGPYHLSWFTALKLQAKGPRAVWYSLPRASTADPWVHRRWYGGLEAPGVLDENITDADRPPCLFDKGLVERPHTPPPNEWRPWRGGRQARWTGRYEEEV